MKCVSLVSNDSGLLINDILVLSGRFSALLPACVPMLKHLGFSVWHIVLAVWVPILILFIIISILMLLVTGLSSCHYFGGFRVFCVLGWHSTHGYHWWVTDCITLLWRPICVLLFMSFPGLNWNVSCISWISCWNAWFSSQRLKGLQCIWQQWPPHQYKKCFMFFQSSSVIFLISVDLFAVHSFFYTYQMMIWIAVCSSTRFYFRNIISMLTIYQYVVNWFLVLSPDDIYLFVDILTWEMYITDYHVFALSKIT